MCVNIMSKRKVISHDIIVEVIVPAHQSGKGYKTVSKQFEFRHSTVSRIVWTESYIM